MDKRYQVFVSSTYTDLINERNEVMQALLELECMPAGMELFPASNETQWNWIKKVIDESDYYIVIVAGRYGSISDDSHLSYTEMEYRYAAETNKPIIAFVHEDISKLPSGLCEEKSENREKLSKFTSLVKKKLCKSYSSPADLGAKVSRSITQLKKQYPATGWIKADVLDKFGSSDEILRLRNENDELKTQLRELENKPPEDTNHLASGTEELEVAFFYKREGKHPGTGRYRKIGIGEEITLLSWNDMICQIIPTVLKRSKLIFYKGDALSRLIKRNAGNKLLNKHPGERLSEFQVFQEDWDTIFMQLRALGLLKLNSEGNWEATPYGDNYYSKLVGVHKGHKKSSKPTG